MKLSIYDEKYTFEVDTSELRTPIRVYRYGQAWREIDGNSNARSLMVLLLTELEEARYKLKELGQC